MKTNEFSRVSDKEQKAYDDEQKKRGLKKVRSFIGNGRYAVRYLPNSYQLRTDEELVETKVEVRYEPN